MVNCLSGKMDWVHLVSCETIVVSVANEIGVNIFLGTFDTRKISKFTHLHIYFIMSYFVSDLTISFVMQGGLWQGI